MTDVLNTIKNRRAQDYARDGFTIIEILIAITIIGLLMAVIVPNFMGYLERGRKSNAKSTIKTFEQALLMYQMDIGQYPNALRDLVKKPAEENIAKKWEGPYLKKKSIPLDPWNNKYQYRPTPEAENPYELYTRGSKGRGASKSEWISVWDE